VLLLVLVVQNSFQKLFSSCLYMMVLMCAADGKWVFEFSVKFYPPEPSILQEEITRLVHNLQNLPICRYLPRSGSMWTKLGSGMGWGKSDPTKFSARSLQGPQRRQSKTIIFLSGIPLTRLVTSALQMLTNLGKNM